MTGETALFSTRSGRAMPRYYIDLRRHFGTTEDPSGIVLPNIAAVHAEALKTARRLVDGWAGVPPKYCDEIIIEVMNEQLRPVLIIPVSDLAAYATKSDPSVDYDL